MIIKYLIQKEFKQIFRSSFLPKLILIFPVVAILVFPWAANQEVTDVRVAFVDHDHSPFSRRLANKIAGSDYFILSYAAASYEEALKTIESGRADLILEIAPGFECDLVREGVSKINISSNAVNGMKGSLAAGYMGAIVQDFVAGLRDEYAAGNTPAAPRIEIVTRNRFNAYLDYKIFMVPAIMVLLITLLCGFLPALNIVGEKEAGTIEQINVTPVGKFTFIVAKLIPYWTIGFIVLSVCILLSILVYGLTPAGNILTIYLVAVVYILVVSGIGLVISNYSATMQQALFVIFFFMMIMILLSGLFTPISGMPDWAKAITFLNPLRYFIEVMRMVYLKGSTIFQLDRQLPALFLFAVVFNIWAVLSYKKSR